MVQSLKVVDCYYVTLLDSTNVKLPLERLVLAATEIPGNGGGGWGGTTPTAPNATLSSPE